MSGECQKCGEHTLDCICYDKEPQKILAYTVYRGVNGEVFLAFKDYDEYIEWAKKLK